MTDKEVCDLLIDASFKLTRAEKSLPECHPMRAVIAVAKVAATEAWKQWGVMEAAKREERCSDG